MPPPPSPRPPLTRCGGCGADVGTPILVVPRASTCWSCCPRETRSLSCPPLPHPRGGRAARVKQGRYHAPPSSPPFTIPPLTRCGGCGADVGTPILVVPRASTWWLPA